MQLSNSPGKLVLPFAASGNKNSIPVDSQIGITPGAASLADGFPPLTMTPVAGGGVPPSGLDMNGILYEMSAVVRWANAGGGYTYDADFANSDDVGGYPKGARVLRADGLGYWFNTVDGNESDPDGSTPVGWVPDFTGGVSVVNMTSANVTLTPAQYGMPIIKLSGTLTANLNLIFPDIAGKWVVINKTTSEGFHVTAKTQSAVGLQLPDEFAGVISSDGVDMFSSEISFNRIVEIGTYADLRSYAGSTTAFYVRGAVNIFDGGFGTFRIDVTDTTSSDNGGTILIDAIGRRWRREWVGMPTIEWWGCETSQSLSGADSIADSYAKFSALLAWCAAINYSGGVRLGRGYYRVTQPIDCAKSIWFEGVGQSESYIHADHLTGPGIRFRNGNSGIRRVGVTASATRRAGAYGAGNNFGVLFEGDDVPEDDPGAPRLLHCFMEDFHLYGHPQGQAHIIGPAFTGIIKNPNLNTTKGHGITFDRGESTGRTNLITRVMSGVCRIGEGRINNCAGHAIAAGSPSSGFSTPALRIVIDNVEGASNATDPAVRYYNTPVYLRGANFVYQNSSLDTNAGGCSAVVAGRNIHLTNNRMLGGYSNAYMIVSYDELPTDGVFIDGMSVINPSASLNPAVLVSRPSGQTIEPGGIFIRQGELGNITAIAATDSSMGSSDFRRIRMLTVNGKTPIAYKSSDSVVNNSTTAVIDQELRQWMGANEFVGFEAVIEYETSATADIKMHPSGPVGSTIKYASGSSSLKIGTTEEVTIQSVSDATLSFGGGGAGVSRLAEISGFCQNGPTAGYLQISFAQLVAEVSDTKIISGISHLKIDRKVN